MEESVLKVAREEEETAALNSGEQAWAPVMETVIGREYHIVTLQEQSTGQQECPCSLLRGCTDIFSSALVRSCSDTSQNRLGVGRVLVL